MGERKSWLVLLGRRGVFAECCGIIKQAVAMGKEMLLRRRTVPSSGFLPFGSLFPFVWVFKRHMLTGACTT